MATSRPSLCQTILFSLLILSCHQPCKALRFYMQDRERRCFGFHAPPSARVIGGATVGNGKGSAELSFEVKSQIGKVVFEAKRGAGENEKFAFVTPAVNDGHHEDYDYEDFDYDDDDELDAKYSVCLLLAFHHTEHVSNSRRSVDFWIRPDSYTAHLITEPKAHEGSIAAIIDSMEAMQNILTAMTRDLASLQQRERRLVKHTKMTGRRLLQMAVVSVVLLTIVSVMQFLHFKTFFKGKKLI
eukprot:GFKZ01002278.1.p2 GENE.GFKZ01002278.1~~GFKZ01002278.1.p2  ORF type:complete len:242 (-),score=32.83 GFKZ01002278.1:1076-1801(-)